MSRIRAAAEKLLAMGVKTYAVRYGSEAGRTPEGDEQLRALVEGGGTAIVDPMNPSAKPYVDATTLDELSGALAQIADRLATCSFALDGLPEDGDKDAANLYLNGEVIPFDAMATGAVERARPSAPSRAPEAARGRVPARCRRSAS